jgi:catechol 2,3-dioxygenase-like lactoylglutathione lyase family enzyme
MTVKRITTNIKAADPSALGEFYTEVFDLDVVMDQGWIVTLSGAELVPLHLSIASQGGSNAPVPALSIEVTDLDTVYARCLAGDHPIEYPITSEPWGVKRFFVRDPAGTLINVMTHI